MPQTKPSTPKNQTALTLPCPHKKHLPTIARAFLQWRPPTVQIATLEGELGAGKTTFVRALIQVLNGNPMEVQSPSYTLLMTYKTPAGTIYHFDVFRLSQPEEWLTISTDILQHLHPHDLVLIEWGDRIRHWLPTPYARIQIIVAHTKNTENPEHSTARLFRFSLILQPPKNPEP